MKGFTERGYSVNWLRNFMMGRYGVDQMNVAVLIFSMACTLIASFTGWLAISLLGMLLLAYGVFRMFSRNIAARQKENQVFLKFWDQAKTFWYRIQGWFRGKKRQFDDRKTHCYFSCPKCHKKLRVPKGKGKIEICCPICGTKFIKKT
mgnify:CR=1 FL=1